jgi:hypothetical protein
LATGEPGITHWNVGVAFLFGLATQWLLRRKLLEL